MKKIRYNWLPDFVYGGIDGAVTTFAVVAGVVGAKLSTPVILIMGFANLFADGFSMATGKYLSDKAELDRINQIKESEQQSILEKPQEEKSEIREILRSFGFKGADLTRAAKVITSKPKIWVKLMLTHEFNVIEENINPIKGALSTFVAFQLVGLIPLLGYVIQPLLGIKDERVLFWTTCVATLGALFLVGTIKSRFSSRHWVLTGTETMVIGGFAASIAFFVGEILSKLLHVS
jgi:VIT1/CCC1 family predicted Fe2+/Mn2+ transporter